MLADLTARELWERVGSDSPTPGGGSIAALMGATGASLIIKFCNLTLGREKFKEVEEKFRRVKEGVQEMSSQLTQLSDRDTEAFDGVMKALRMPKTTDQEIQRRKDALQQAFREASEVPHQTAEFCLSLLQACQEVVEEGNPNAISDLGVGCLACWAGLEGAILNVKINLPSLKDSAFVEEMKAKILSISQEGEALKSQVLHSVRQKIEG